MLLYLCLCAILLLSRLPAAVVQSDRLDFIVHDLMSKHTCSQMIAVADYVRLWIDILIS